MPRRIPSDAAIIANHRRGLVGRERGLEQDRQHQSGEDRRIPSAHMSPLEPPTRGIPPAEARVKNFTNCLRIRNAGTAERQTLGVFLVRLGRDQPRAVHGFNFVKIA
jgi:hypothetical protein